MAGAVSKILGTRQRVDSLGEAYENCSDDHWSIGVLGRGHRYARYSKQRETSIPVSKEVFCDLVDTGVLTPENRANGVPDKVKEALSTVLRLIAETLAGKVEDNTERPEEQRFAKVVLKGLSEVSEEIDSKGTLSSFFSKFDFSDSDEDDIQDNSDFEF